MQFKSNNPKLTTMAMGHFKKFIEEYSLFTHDTPLLIAVSGGIDSMLLALMVYNLKRFGYSNELRFIYVNHNTRKGQLQERDLVEALAHHLEVKFVSKTLQGLDTNSNFEFQARKLRYHEMQNELQTERGEVLLFAHHIDDSYEWSILQGLRSSNLISTIGIPVYNGVIRRPFMCLTKKQIISIAKAYDLPFLQDPTNEQIKYERNFLRSKITKVLGHRHPKYLKHYVNRHNELARRLGKHLLLNKTTSLQLHYYPSAVEIISFKEELEFSGLEEAIFQAINYLGPNQRGSLHGQLTKLKQAMQNRKLGPLLLSGNIELYIDFNHLLLIKNLEPLSLKPTVQIFSYEEFSDFVKKYWSSQTAPGFYFQVQILDNPIGFTQTNVIHPIITKYANGNTQILPSISITNLLRQWQKEKNCKKKLKLTYFQAY
jgi:tRNA(Ile)-lysidine synthase